MPSTSRQTQLPQEAFSSLSSELTPEDLEQIMQSVRKLPSAAEKKGITQEELAQLYKLGFDLYKAEYFEQASDLFRLLCFYEPRESKNWLALGGAAQRLKNHSSALAAFAMAAFYDPLNPDPRFYAAHSFIDLKNLPMALESAEAALALCRTLNDKNNIAKKTAALRDALLTLIH